MGLFRRKQIKLNDITPEFVVNIIIASCFKDHEEFLSKPTTNYSQATLKHILSESIKSRTAQFILCMNSLRPESAQAFFNGTMYELQKYYQAKLATSHNVAPFDDAWCDDLESTYLLYELDEAFFVWARKFSGTLQMKPFNEADNVMAKPTYVLTYRLLEATNSDKNNILEMSPCYIEASTSVLSTQEMLNKFMALK